MLNNTESSLFCSSHEEKEKQQKETEEELLQAKETIEELLD